MTIATGEPDDSSGEPHPKTDPPMATAAQRSRRSRRATLPAPAGSDPEPFDPPVAPRSNHENDTRLAEDKPPHWG